jgi:hypothetical protein
MKPESRPSSKQGLVSAVNLAGPLIKSSRRQLWLRRRARSPASERWIWKEASLPLRLGVGLPVSPPDFFKLPQKPDSSPFGFRLNRYATRSSTSASLMVPPQAGM